MYSQHSISAITDVPSLVSTFAAAAGWTVSGSSGSPILTRPSMSGAVSFQLTGSVSGYDHELTWTAVSAPVVTSSAKIRSPKLKGTASVPVVSMPTKVHLFGDMLPAPFMAIVVEYGYNLYRHLYFGYVEPFGSFTGGEVIGAANFGSSASPAGVYPRNYKDLIAQYLFDAYQNQWAATQSGGVRAEHTDNAVPWRKFSGTTGPNSVLNLTTQTAIGGFKDDINSGYLIRGRSQFDGAAVLVPMTLYAVRQGGNPPTFAPLGVPAGVRMINLTDVDPGTEIVIGSQTWKVFAAWKKNPTTTINQFGSGWGEDESSGMVGYAYPEVSL